MDVTALRLSIKPALSSPAPPAWTGAVWVGEVWLDTVTSLAAQSIESGQPIRCELEQADGYRRARLLVRAPGRTFGFVEVDVVDGAVDFEDLQAGLAGCVSADGCHNSDWASGGVTPSRSVSVVICTRDRPLLLQSALESVLALDYANFDVIVVDNASSTSATRDHVRALTDPRVRLVEEPHPGLSRARNVGLLAATGEVVAFVDDDAVVDPYWLSSLVKAFDYTGEVSCVSGIVPAGEIRTPAQAAFDQRVSWSDSASVRIFDWRKPPVDMPLFPFAVGEYGTGANFAVDRRTVARLGGFDENLGAGSATHGGEDLDIFFRILRSGGLLVHEPAAIVWHRHRDNDDALHAQIRGYGLGLGAFLSKVASQPAIAWLAARTVVTRAPAFLRHLRTPSHQASMSLMFRGAWEYHRACWKRGQPPPVISAEPSSRRRPD